MREVKVPISIDGVVKQESPPGILVHVNRWSFVSIFPAAISSVPFEHQDPSPAPAPDCNQRVDLQLQTDSPRRAPATNCCKQSICLGVSR